MSRIAFIGKTTITEREDELLSTIGMALGMDGNELLTTPTGAAAAATAQGYRAAAGRVATLRQKPVANADHVIVYPDDTLLKALLEREPSPLTLNWIVLLNLTDLEFFADLCLTFAAEKESPNA